MKDNFSDLAGEYAKFRPSYPEEMFDFILSHVSIREAAWDCATGNGQAARVLARYFQHVYATDISQKQVLQAVYMPNIFYSVQPAEKTDFRENQFDLVTIAQALHWFHFDKFYREVARVSRPGAIIAAWAYSLIRVSPGIDAILDDFHYKIMGPYWDAERKFVDDQYRTIPFFAEKITAPAFYIQDEWSLVQLEGYLNTWSSLPKFMAHENYNPVSRLIGRLQSYWGNDERPIRFPLHLLMSRIVK